MVDRPSIVTPEHLEFLNDLRDSATINMAGAAPELREEFDLSKLESRAVCKYWRDSFGERT